MIQFTFGLVVGLGIAIFFPKTFTKIREYVMDLIRIAMDR